MEMYLVMAVGFLYIVIIIVAAFIFFMIRSRERD
jgi:hypothetical protein